MTNHRYQAAVLGSPINHSKSPDMHQAVYDYLDVAIDYGRFELTEDQAGEFFTALHERFGSRKQLAGFSVTMPLKAVLVKHMDHISDRVRLLGVLNTIIFDEAGDAVGENTDVDGIRLALNKAGFRRASGGSMGVLGAGGTATAAVAAAAEMDLKAIVLYVRNPQRAQATFDVAEAFGLATRVAGLEDFPLEAAQHQAVVSTLPAHAADGLAEHLPAHGLPPLLDVIYDPWPTVLANQWTATGAHIASGLDMLLYQGVEQAKLFTEKLLVDPGAVDWEEATQQMAAALGLDHG